MRLAVVTDYVPDAVVDMRYTGDRNIAHRPISTELAPRLVPAAAKSLGVVADQLRKQGLRLAIWDAYRPQAVQAQLLAIVNDQRYVLKDSKHCQGVALDLTLARADGTLIDMGTDHDTFSEQAHADATGLTKQQLRNRQLLTQTMERHGFFAQWPYEWWHFDYLQ